MTTCMASTSTDSVKAQIKSALKNLEGMQEVEALIQSKLTSEAALLSEIPRYLLELGGKRLRPALTLLVARLVAPQLEHPVPEVVDVAAGIELIHMATLLHDDIIDKSPLRRHQASPFLKYGAGNTLLSGDFLLVRAFSLCARLDKFVIDHTETACVELTEGEILETALCESSHTVESSINIAAKKTAALFRLAAACGSHLSLQKSTSAELHDQSLNSQRRVVQHLSDFGLNLGIAFQMLDDILDVTSTDETLGKQTGIDILERKPSIVNVLWLRSGSALAKRLSSPPHSDPEVEKAFVTESLEELRDSPVIPEAKALAAEFAGKAQKALDNCAESWTLCDAQALSALQALIEYTLTRAL